MNGNGHPPAQPQVSEAEMVVLIVDDEQPIADLIGVAVSQAGHTPVLAFHGRQALEKAREQWPALVITDLMMPLLDGAGFIAALRQDASEHGRRTPPIVVMTAASLPSAEAAGADAVLGKPFELSDLERLLDEFIPEPT
jgi:CheY-like chemotaxis protein